MPLLLLIPLAVAVTGGGVWAASEGVESLVKSTIKIALVGGAIYIGGKAVRVW